MTLSMTSILLSQLSDLDTDVASMVNWLDHVSSAIPSNLTSYMRVYIGYLENICQSIKVCRYCEEIS